MKKLISGMVIAGLAVSIGLNAIAYTGGAYETKLNCWINKIKIKVNGKAIKTTTGIDTILVTDKNGKGTTYVPIRFISEKLGYIATYDGNTATVYIDVKGDELYGWKK